MKRLHPAALLAVLLVGCAGSPNAYDPSRLSPEQLNALSKDKASIVSCTFAEYLTARITTVFINIDMGRLDGTVVVSSDCSAQMNVSRPQ